MQISIHGFSSHQFNFARMISVRHRPRQTITAQSVAIHAEIRNSGSGRRNRGRSFFRRMKLAVVASSTRVVPHRKLYVRRRSRSNNHRRVMNVLDESFDTLGSFPLSVQHSFDVRNLVTGSASRSATSGPFPERQRVWVGPCLGVGGNV